MVLAVGEHLVVGRGRRDMRVRGGGGGRDEREGRRQGEGDVGGGSHARQHSPRGLRKSCENPAVLAVAARHA
jgi:hypothetical protein